MIAHMLTMILGTIVALLPITNPVSTAALFLTITKDDSKAKRNQQALKGCIYVFCILVSFLIAGRLIMDFFGISIPGLRIAGGILVARVGLNMLQMRNDDSPTKEARTEAMDKEDISFTPLAMPSMSGPGAIAATIGLATQAQQVLDFVAITIGIAIVASVCWIVLRASTRILEYLGVNGINTISRIMGFLLLCVGVQFVVNGIIGVISDPATMRTIIETYRLSVLPPAL